MATVWMIAVLRWFLMAINSAEIIINLIYFMIHFSTQTDSQQQNRNNNNLNGNSDNDDQSMFNNNDQQKKPSSPWLTILTNSNKLNNIHDQQTMHGTASKTNGDDNRNSDENNLFENNDDDNYEDYGFCPNNDGDFKVTNNFQRVSNVNKKHGTTTINNKNNGKTNKFFNYKTLPKTFSRPSTASSSGPSNSRFGFGTTKNQNNVKFKDSQESLKSSSGISSSSSSLSSTSNNDNATTSTFKPPTRPPPTLPPSVQQHRQNVLMSKINSNSYLYIGANQRHHQLTISLALSLIGFFIAQFQLSWLLLAYSFYLFVGIILWFYSRLYIYRKTRKNNPVDQMNMAKSLASTPLSRSAPCQSISLSSALCSLIGYTDIDEVHIQLMAPRQDVVDVTLKFLLASSSFLLSSY